MNYTQIHKALKKQGLTWVAAAEVIGCSSQHVMNVCSGRVESARVAKAIAVLIGKSVAEVFPAVPRYQEDRKAQRASTISHARERLAEAGLVAA